MKHIAIFHDGEYHNDSTPFIPQLDNIKCDLNTPYEELIDEYSKKSDKVPLVKGVFILQERTFKVLTTKDPATAWLEGKAAAAQNTHQLRACASGSVRVIGVLPDSSIEYTEENSKYQEICDAADEIHDIMEQYKRSKDGK